MTKIKPLNFTSVKEIHLPRAPLERVISQTRVPPILSIRNPDKVAVFQEKIQQTYPCLNKEEFVQSIKLGSSEPEDLQTNIIWRFTDGAERPKWRVSLGEDFVSLETKKYYSRKDFLKRLSEVLYALECTFEPTTAVRFGLRYIDRLKGKAVENISELVQPEVLGISKPTGKLSRVLKPSVISQITEVQFLASKNNLICGRWGPVPKNAAYDQNAIEAINSLTWVLDLDMFTAQSFPFDNKNLLKTAKEFSERIYWVFRQMVTEEFLKYYGGKF